MGVKMNILVATADIAQRNSALLSNVDALERLKTALEQYVLNDELVSEAYESHKTYIKKMQLPVVDGMILLCKTLLDANKRYQSIMCSMAPTVWIDQDTWEEILSHLIEEYNYLLSCAFEMEEEEKYQEDYESKTNTGKKYDNMYYIKGIYYEINLIYNLINEYKSKLQKLEEMIYNLNGIYEQVDILNEALKGSIDLLLNVPISSEGMYGTLVMNLEPIHELEDAMVSCELSDKFREEIGDETYQALINGDLSKDEVNNVLNVALGMGYEHITKYIGVPGHYEYYIFPNITFYADTTCSAEIGTDLPVSVELSLEEDVEFLLSTNLFGGNIGIGASQDNIGIDFSYSETIDDNSEFYYEAFSNYISTSVECGVNSSISDVGEFAEISTTVAAGVTYSVSGNGGNDGWTPTPVPDYDYINIPIPDVEIELQPIEYPEDVNTELATEHGKYIIGLSYVVFIFSLIEPSPVVIPPIP